MLLLHYVPWGFPEVTCATRLDLSEQEPTVRYDCSPSLEPRGEGWLDTSPYGAAGAAAPAAEAEGGHPAAACAADDVGGEAVDIGAEAADTASFEAEDPRETCDPAALTLSLTATLAMTRTLALNLKP